MPTLNRQKPAQRDLVPPSPQVQEVADNDCSAETVASQEKPVLPLALRDIEITQGDVETLLRVAKDKKAPAGRYRRIQKKLPVAHPE